MVKFFYNLFFPNKFRKKLSFLLELLEHEDVYYYSDKMVIYLKKDTNDIEGYFEWGEVYSNYIIIREIDTLQIEKDLFPLYNNQKIRKKKMVNIMKVIK